MNRLGLTLIGFGLWLASAPRPTLWRYRCWATGQGAVRVLNAYSAKVAEQREMDARNAKPSSRKRVR